MGNYIMYLRKSRADRDSSSESAEQTLDRHKARLDELCCHLEIKCSIILKEVGSADSIAARPEMIKLLQLVETGQYTGVLCMDMDRLSRGSGADQALVINTFKYSGTKIITPSKTYDFSEESDEQFAELGLFIAKQEYRQIKKRMMQGRISAVHEGKYSAGLAPYGYKTVKLQGQKGYSLEVIPDEADLIRAMFDMYVNQLKGSHAIASALNSQGHRDQRGNLWTDGHVRKILQDPTYIGKVRFKKRLYVMEMENGVPVRHERKNPDPIIAKGLHDPIISEDLFQRAEARRIQREIPHVSTTIKIANPFAGIIRCSRCGKNLSVRTPDKYGRALYCNTPGCTTKQSYLDRIEEGVLKSLGDWLTDYEATPQERSDRRPELQRTLKQLTESLSKLKLRLKRIYEAFEDGAYDKEEFSVRSSAVKDQIFETENLIVSTGAELEKEEKEIRARKEFRPAVKSLIEHYHEIDSPEEKNRLLKEIVDHIDYTKDSTGKLHRSEFDLLIFPKIPQ